MDAVFNAISALVPHQAQLELYQVHAVTGGTDAQAEVSVRLRDGERSVTARGADPDTLVASAKAYLSALNKLSAHSCACMHSMRRRNEKKLRRGWTPPGRVGISPSPRTDLVATGRSQTRSGA